jgi:type IV pilus assembly protein PilQ
VTETAAVEDVEFLDLGVVLTVKARVSRDHRVLMNVKPEVSSGGINPETQLPEEETTEVSTDVLLSDGQGIVIGGLIQEKDSNVQSKLPWLGDIRWVGLLFQHRQVQKTRSEIIITLMPRVLPYPCEYESQDQTERDRADAPLVYGPLCKYPRPWEPVLPDTLYNPRLIRRPCEDPSGCPPPRCYVPGNRGAVP